MAQRRLAFPGTMLQNQSLITRTQKSFGGGMNSDDPSTDIGADELAELFNKIAYPKYIKGRTGCAVPGSGVALPTIDYYPDAPEPEKTTFRASKTGNVVSFFSTGSAQFRSQLINGQYIAWSDGTRDQIINLNTTLWQFTSVFSGDQAEQYAPQQSRVWGADWNEANEKIIIQLGTKFYYTDNTFAAYTEIVGREGVAPAESRTRFDFDDDQIIAFNANGIYRLIFDEDSAYYIKINEGQPTTRIFEDPKLPSKDFIRNRIYTLCLITGPGALYGNRNTAGCVLLQESAPVLSDANHKDASLGYADLPFGPGVITYDELRSGMAVETNVTVWNTYTDGSFMYKGHIFISDFSDALNMNDVVATLQRNIRDFYPKAEVVFRDGLIVITESKDDGTVMGYVAEPDIGTHTEGTSITGLLQMFDPGTSSIGGTLITVDADTPQLIYDLNAPAFKWTHYGIYESKNGGPAGLLSGNLIDELVWVADIPIIKTFRCDRNDNHLITVSSGLKLFAREDEGTFIAWADATGDTAAGIESERIVNLVSALDPALPSKNNTEASVIGNGLAGTSPSILKDDVPIAMGAKKISQGYQSGNIIHLDPTYNSAQWNHFDAGDVGKILFLEDGSIRHILSVEQDGITCTVHESGDFGYGGTPGSYFAIAWDPILRTDIASPELGDNKFIFFDKGEEDIPTPDFSLLIRTGGASLDASDAGKRLYIFVGGVLITDYWYNISTPSGDQVLLGSDGPPTIPDWFLAEMKGAYGIIVDQASSNGWIPARFFNDYFTDTEIASNERSPYYLLQTRFFIPLPSSCIGALAGNFMFVAEEGTNKIAYSEMPEGRKYIVGFYHPTWQFDTKIQDVVTHLKSYPDRMIAFCKSSIWGSNISAFTSLKEPAIGEEIFTVPIFSIIEQLGLIHLGAIQDIAVGQSLLICSDAGVRTFDGRQLSQINYAQNKIYKSLQLWHVNTMSSYDPVGGFMIFGSPNVSSDVRNFVNMTEGQCFRLAVFAHQGGWWSKYGGEPMVSPMPYTGGLSMGNPQEIPIQVMLDERTGKWHQINTFNGPAGSNLTEAYGDKGDLDIVTKVRGITHKGQRLSITLEHMESHIHVQPIAQGALYRPNLSTTSKIYTDNGASYFAKTLDTPQDGDIVYDRKAQSKMLQNEFEFSSSKLIVDELEVIYNTRDTAGSTAMDRRPTSEDNHQRGYTGL